MMTEERRKELVDFCENVLAAHVQWGGDSDEEDLYKFALAALTQPASPALKLPDGWVAVPLEPSREMRLASKRYKSKTKLPTGPGVYKAMVAAAPAAPHTAPIEPICATGRTMPPHEFSQMVNELRDVDNAQSKRAKIIGILHAFNIRPRKQE